MAEVLRKKLFQPRGAEEKASTETIKSNQVLQNLRFRDL